jgi:hypothetical protein
MSSSSKLPQAEHYILLRTTPPVDELTLRHALHAALAQAFGITVSTHLDVLFVAQERAVVRVANGCVPTPGASREWTLIVHFM